MTKQAPKASQKLYNHVEGYFVTIVKVCTSVLWLTRDDEPNNIERHSTSVRLLNTRFSAFETI